jgi:hypothetical protein
VQTVIRVVTIAFGLASVGSIFGAPGSHAAGHAPWCAVVNLGMGDVSWDCRYRTVEECVPNVIAGNRGFCNLNWPGAGAAASLKRHPEHHVRRG